jgi:hypothetical protein
MSNDNSAASQWNIPSSQQDNSVTDSFTDNMSEGDNLSNSDAGSPAERTIPDTMKRRGFFEAIRQTNCTQTHLVQFLKEHEQQAKEKLQDIDRLAEKRIEHLEERIRQCKSRIIECKEKLNLLTQYREADDPDFQQMVTEKQREEAHLILLQQKLTDVRIRLGRAKAGIVSQSLEEAEAQIRSALNIQHVIYDESRILNEKKFRDEKDHFAHLSKCYQELYNEYEKRYQKVNKYLTVLDVDGMSPITSKVLANIGTISFGAAGFFFSTFAGYAGFGNQDMLYFIFGGLIKTAGSPMHWLVKIAVLLGLIALVTIVSFACNVLITWFKNNSDEEILSEVALSAQVSKKFKQLEYQASIKSNNIYAFWLQLIPAILVIGLLLLSLSQSATANNINAINSSSEGLIVGTSIAISLAGLIYFYIIKIVEPRLLKRYYAEPGRRVNWALSNWELIIILIAFIGFSFYILTVPYRPRARTGVISIDEQTRYAILLFMAICLLGSISFAYGVRYRGLIATNRYLEKVMRWLNSVVAYCSTPEAPDVHNKVSEEHGNIIQHVLRQLSFKTVINPASPPNLKKKGRGRNFFKALTELMKKSKEEETPIVPEPVKVITVMEPWEERYFPHLVDELKAVEFAYSERRRTIQAIDNNILEYRRSKDTELSVCESEITQCRNDIMSYETKIEEELKEKAERCQKARNAYNKTVTDLLDGYHLGMWYRENGMGPTAGYFIPAVPDKPTPIDLISSQ